ncbi:MAG: hypothetical protein IKX40_08915 [Thermoguttaceae bacterium]|nr:hypothetical protein [Thermoguttaceae bacterium]
MRRKHRSKCKNLELHTKRRTLERVGIAISKKQYKEMSQICSHGKYFCFLKKQSLARSKAVIRYQDEFIPIVYDKNRKQIITVLSIDMLTKSEKAILQKAINQYNAALSNPHPSASV